VVKSQVINPILFLSPDLSLSMMINPTTKCALFCPLATINQGVDATEAEGPNSLFLIA
jgi:hypothetical protein